jgi:hypothetical protein
MGAQLVGSCPPVPRRSPQDVKELGGVVVDQNLAVVPKEKVLLQIQHGEKFRDVAAVDTDSSGRFNFRSQRRGKYRFIFSGQAGLCRAEVPVRYASEGFHGIRLVLPVAATDTCPQYCESRLKIEEMSGREGHE